MVVVYKLMPASQNLFIHEIIDWGKVFYERSNQDSSMDRTR